MRHSYASNHALRTLVMAIVLIMFGMPAMAETVVPLGPFKAVTLHNGGRVILRHGSAQRVTILQGSTERTGLTIADGDRLMIEGDCRSENELSVEILTPAIAEISVSDGGTIQTDGSFPRQSEITVVVANGGTIDLRSMSVDAVTAGVHDGGRIFTKPHEVLVANVARGGVITHWGTAHVRSSIRNGGVVAKGAAADADRPLTGIGDRAPAVPAVPAVPPGRARRST